LVKKSTNKIKGNPILLIALVAAIVIVGYYAGSVLGMWGATVTEAPSVEDDDDDSSSSTTIATDYEFLVLDYYNGDEMDEDDHDLNMYRVDVSELDADEIDDLLYADYSLATSALDSGDDYDPDEDYDYYMLLNGSDICDYWFIPVLGLNTIYAMNETEDVAMVAYSTDELSTTVNQTNYDEWTIRTQCLDGAEGTGEATAKEGYKGCYDFSDDDNTYVVIKITFNTTAQLSWCDFESNYDVNELTAASVLYYEVDVVLLDSQLFEIDFGSTLGTAYEVIQIDVAYGDADSCTSWDAQN